MALTIDNFIKGLTNKYKTKFLNKTATSLTGTSVPVVKENSNGELETNLTSITGDDLAKLSGASSGITGTISQAISTLSTLIQGLSLDSFVKNYQNINLDTIGNAIGKFDTCLNAPQTYVFGISISYGIEGIQIMISQISGVMYFRVRVSGVWQNWKTVIVS